MDKQSTYTPLQGPIGQPTQNVGMATGASCPHCRVGSPQENFTCCYIIGYIIGILLGICLFPIGIICCSAMKEKTCSHCGHQL